MNDNDISATIVARAMVAFLDVPPITSPSCKLEVVVQGDDDFVIVNAPHPCEMTGGRDSLLISRGTDDGHVLGILALSVDGQLMVDAIEPFVCPTRHVPMLISCDGRRLYQLSDIGLLVPRSIRMTRRIHRGVVLGRRRFAEIFTRMSGTGSAGIAEHHGTVATAKVAA